MVALFQAYLVLSVCLAARCGRPHLHVASPLQSEQEHDDCWCEEHKTDKVELLVQLTYNYAWLVLDVLIGHASEDQQDCDDAADREVDVDYALD